MLNLARMPKERRKSLQPKILARHQLGVLNRSCHGPCRAVSRDSSPRYCLPDRSHTPSKESTYKAEILTIVAEVRLFSARNAPDAFLRRRCSTRRKTRLCLHIDLHTQIIPNRNCFAFMAKSAAQRTLHPHAGRRKKGFRSFQDDRLDLSARAEYIVPPNSEGRVATLSTGSTPASLKSWRSLSKPTGYGPHLVGLGRSYSTIRKRSATDRSLLSSGCCS